MTALQKILIIVTLFAAVGLVFYEANQAETLRIQVQALQRQQASLSEQIRKLRIERREDANLQTWFFSPVTQPSRVATFAGIMNDPNFRVIIHALENRNGFEQMAEPEAVTTGGRRENRMRVSDIFINVIPLGTNHTSSTGQH